MCSVLTTKDTKNAPNERNAPQTALALPPRVGNRLKLFTAKDGNTIPSMKAISNMGTITAYKSTLYSSTTATITMLSRKDTAVETPIMLIDEKRFDNIRLTVLPIKVPIPINRAAYP